MRETILVVDDNLEDIVLTERALRKNLIFNEIVKINSGEEALDYLFGTGKYAQEPHSLPVLLLLDLNMPGTGGFSVLKQVRENPKTRSMPVIILAGSKESQDIVKSFITGGNAYINKPIDMEQLMSAVRQARLGWKIVPPSDSPNQVN